MDIVFFGSPDFAVPSLRALDKSFSVQGVITQPDRPAGRGRRVRFPAVKQTALELDLPVIQPLKLSEPTVHNTLTEWDPDVIVVAAYGQILPPDLLSFPPHGCINVHASLLPRWRGAAPIQAAILHGDHETGITIMQMDAGLDTGPILTQESVQIGPDETGGELFDRLAPLGADLLVRTLPAYREGQIEPVPQQESLATYAPMLTKEDGLLDFSKSAEQLSRQIRAFNPWPGSFFYWQRRRHIVHRAEAVDRSIDLAEGTTTEHNAYPAISCRSGLLVLRELQPAGKTSMDGSAFLNGAQHFPGQVLSSQHQTT